MAFHPLRTSREEPEPYWVAAVGRAAILAFFAMPPLVLLQALEVVHEAVPPLVLGVLLVVGGIGETGLRWRRRNAHLRLRLTPDALELVHTLGRLPVVTEELPLEAIRKVEVDEQGTLRLALLDGRTVCEPLPGLDPEARDWVVEMLQEARKSNADFWRDQVRTAADQDAVRRLTDQLGVSPPR